MHDNNIVSAITIAIGIAAATIARASTVTHFSQSLPFSEALFPHWYRSIVKAVPANDGELLRILRRLLRVLLTSQPRAAVVANHGPGSAPRSYSRFDL